MTEQPSQSDAEILKALEQTEKNRSWIARHYDELRMKYEGKVFAVKDGAPRKRRSVIPD